jgi:hypothetical protein
VFYDVPYPQKATGGLEAYQVLRFAVGIAVPANGTTNYGMSPTELKTQKQQLKAFVGPNPSLFKSLGQTGWALLTDIAHDISVDLPRYFSLEKPTPRYTWCGYRRITNCELSGWRNGRCRWPDKTVKEWGCKRAYLS